MATVHVVSDDELIVVDIVQDDEGWTTGRCQRCRTVLTDRGHFEDTVQAAGVHADKPH